LLAESSPFFCFVLCPLSNYENYYRIIDQLKLMFLADKPPQPLITYQEVLTAAEAGGDYYL
jgi:hypothetical protein